MTDQDDLTDAAEEQLLSAEYKDGQLQIVEVSPFDKDDVSLEGEPSTVLAELGAGGETKYVQLETSDRSIMQLDLLNLTLVRCADSESYRLVANGDASGDSNEATVTCVLASSDNETTEEPTTQEYVMMNNEQGSLVFLQTAMPQTEPATVIMPEPEEMPPENTTPVSQLTAEEILERAKELQRAKALQPIPKKTRGRKRKSDLPSPQELLSSPNFKLFLYSCKMCSFKCNAIKDMTAHKATEHRGKYKNSGRGGSSTITLQCARCPYKGPSHHQLMKHVQALHTSETTNNKVYLDTDEVKAADVLVCGACGFESACRAVFRKHIEVQHGATTC